MLMVLPDADALASEPLHVVVRDFPEALAVCRRVGIDVAARGAEPVVVAAGADMAALYTGLRRATAWRANARPGPCDRAAARAAALRADAGARADQPPPD